MKYLGLLLLFMNFFSITTTAQSNCKCCTPHHREFDFWLGDWEVFSTDHHKIGENKITSIQDSCVLLENWKSKNSTGTSYNYFDPSDQTWNQLYLDNGGSILKLKGRSENGKMVLKSEKQKSQKAEFFYYNRIIWEPQPDGNVSQKWDVVTDRDSILQVAFHGIYRRKG
ncbi:MAG: hypothetical protein IPM34_00810 [Saprospiraceae bacterium]|nr:hypothetical protein [Saprospiraceae bacterium]